MPEGYYPTTVAFPDHVPRLVPTKPIWARPLFLWIRYAEVSFPLM